MCFAGLSCSRKESKSPLRTAKVPCPGLWAGLGKGPRRLPPPLLLLPPSWFRLPWHSPTTLPTKFVPTRCQPLSWVPGATRSPWLLSPPPTPPERDSGDPLVDESLKRQGFQGKVAAQDGVSWPNAMTLTWPWRARLGVGGAGCQPQGPPRRVV